MWNLLKSIQKHLIIAIPVAMILGLVTGRLFDTSILKATIIPLTFLMVYPMMVNIPLRKIVEGGDFKVQLFAQIINFAILPFAAYFTGKIFLPDEPYWALGLLLAALLPTSGMTISWTGMAKGNMAAAIKMTIAGLLIGSFLTPLYIEWLLGATITIPLGKVFMQIMIVVVVPLILGNITQRLIVWKYGREHYQKEIKGYFPPLSTLGVLGIVFVALALKADSILNSPELLLKPFVILAVLYIFNYTLSTIVGKIFFKRADAIALVYATVMRNLSIALAIAMNAFGKEGSNIALVIALAYLIQVQSAAWYVKFTDKIFGASAKAETPVQGGILITK